MWQTTTTHHAQQGQTIRHRGVWVWHIQQHHTPARCGNTPTYKRPPVAEAAVGFRGDEALVKVRVAVPVKALVGVVGVDVE